MKKSSIAIAILLFSAAVLTDAALKPQTVTAGLYCSQLRNCTGDAGCANSGSANGCVITCGDNSSVECVPSGHGDDDLLN
jgi:hypothetical protein